MGSPRFCGSQQDFFCLASARGLEYTKGMTPLFWTILIVLHALTILWFIIIRKDILSYMHTQIKLLGQEHEHKINNFRFRFLIKLYAFSLIVIMGAFTLYLASYGG